MTLTFFCRHASALAALALLSACGGGGSSSNGPTTLVAAADTMNLGTGQTASVLANDTVGGAAARVGASGNATVTFSGTLPQGVTVADGVVSVARGAVPGSFTLNYQLCEAAAASNCASGAVALTVPKPPIVATADTVSIGPGETASLLANDQLDGVAATATTVTVTTTGTWPTGVTLGADGVLTAANAAAAGASTLAYRICQTASPTNCADGSVSLTLLLRVGVSGRVVNGLTGVPLADIDVKIGSRSVKTDAQGQFSVTGLPTIDRAVVSFTGAGYGEGARILNVGENGVSGLLARLVPVTATATVDAAAGGTVSNAAGSARVVLPAASLAKADGTTLTGNATVNITAINPSLDSSLMPGDYTTISGGNAVAIESYGALGVQITDAIGGAANLRTGQTATIRIPLASRDDNPPATIPLFHFDVAAGRWVQEGTATLQGPVTGARYYEGTVSHFSTWNADRVAETVWVNGCVSDAAGARVAGASITSDGIDYSGTTNAVTDAGGAFRIAVRKDSLATLIAVKSLLVSNTLRVTTPANGELTLPDCLVLAANANGVSIKLTWGDKPRDLDSHLWTPSGAHVYYSSKGQLASAPFANLDVDDTSSFGPEVVTLTKLMVGTYKYAVKNYSGYSSGPIAVSGARVELILPGGSTELFVPPATGETASTSFWTLFELTVDAQCNVTLSRTEAYTGTEPTVPTATPTYCSRN